MRFKNIFFLLFLVTLLSFQLLSAQTAGTGALTGTIKDPSGAVVPNATVTLTSLGTGASRTSTTGADGVYKFDLLPPGNYKVRVEAAGFKPVEIPSAKVDVTETEVLDRNLEVGAQTQTITVEGEVVAIQTTSSALGTVADARTMTELPLNTRNYTNLLAMSTGVAANVSNATTIGKGATNMAVNGGSTGQNTYLMDGVVVNNWTALGGVTEGTLPGTFAMPNPDAISEFKIQTSSYDAGYGRNPGANVNVITKSGTNSFHGSAFEFFRNTALNANDWFLAGEGQPKAVLNSNVYGGSVGGPIKKDKLFFFANYQEEDQTNGYASYSQSATDLPPIPTGNRGTCGPAGFTSTASCDTVGAAFVKALATNMSQFQPTARGSTALIQNPTTCASGTPGPAGPCDTMGLYNINPIAISILQLKLPNGNYFVPGSGDFAGCNPTQFCNHRFENPASFKDHQGIGNLDYVINSKNTFSGRYVYEADPINANFPAVNALEPGNAVPGNTVSTQKTNQDVVAKLTTIVSNNAVNEFHVGYQRNTTVNSEAVLFHNSQLGIQDFVSPFTPGAAVDNMSYINIGPGGSQMDFGVHPFFGSHANFNQFIVGDQISINHGKHTFRVGFDVERVQGASFSGTGSVGQPAFTSFSDFLIGRAGCSNNVVTGNIAGATSPGLDPTHPGGCNGGSASSITGTGGTTTANSTSQVNPRVLLPSAFVQDDIKLNSRFTLNLGLRWEFDQWPTENNGNYSTFWQNLAANSAPPIVASCTVGAAACPGESLVGYVVPSNYTALIPTGVFQNATPYYTRKSAPLDDFAPRIGFAWQPTSSNKLVLRGGAGYFYDLISGQYTGNFGRTNPLFGPPASGSPAATLQNPWAIPGGVVSAGPSYFGFVPRWIIPGTCATTPAKTASACGGNTSSTGVTSYQDLTIPLTYEWNMNVQYEFLPNWVLEVGYVGSHGIHQASPGAVQNNTADGSPISTPYNAAQLVGGGPCVNCAANGVTVNSNGNAFLRVPVLGLNSGATQLETISNYKFNSLQATVRHQFAHGFQLQAAYSWSRGFEQVPTGVNTYPYVLQEYAPEYFVRPQRLILNYVWNLPAPRVNGILGRVIDDWSWSGVVTIQDGQPIDIVDSGDGGIFGLASQAGNIGQPQLCPGFTSSQILTSGSTSQRVANGLLPNGNGWINSAAFISCGDAVPSNVGAINGVGGGVGFGNYGFGNILGPGQANWDMSLAKLIKIHEAQSLQFRAEFYNTFNHPQFSNLPGSDVANGTTMGQITTTSVSPRVIQFALKFLF